MCWDYLGKEAGAGKVNRPHSAQGETERVGHGEMFEGGDLHGRGVTAISWAGTLAQ